ncbi:MAG: histidine phosphatase family protein [Acidobacteria bacterium]|nr:histidine phosphatase family protein [Acidobacteriota bacterium]
MTIPRRQLPGIVLACLLLLPASLGAQREGGTLRIYLARHGESDANAAGRVSGWQDVRLTAKGRQQAEVLRESLRAIPIDAVYSSTLSRSRETARILRPDTPATPLDSLKEKSGGRFEGLPAGDPELLRRLRDPDDALDGGESLNQLTGRVRRGLDQIRREHPSGTVLVVGHAWTNRAILRVLLDLPAERAFAVDQGNDELYLIELGAGGRPRLWKLIREGNLGDL